MPMSPAPAFATEKVVTFDDFELDFPGFELRRAGVPVPMEPQAFEVLAFLVENAGRVLTKDEILDRVWPERYVSEASLNSRVMTARKALGDSGSEQRYIKTIHGRGYRFIGVANEASAEALTAVKVATPPTPGATSRLAPPATSFVGRERELGRMSALMAQSSCRQLTVAGPGGIGKTRLVQEFLASAAAADYEFLVIELEHVAPEQLVAAVAAGCGVNPSGDDTLIRLVEFLADREVVLVLDNLEPVVDAARVMIDTILRGTQSVRFLTTSRVTVGSQSEWLLRVDGLSTEGEPGGHSDAAALFLSRANQAGGNEHSEYTEDVDAICRMLDGLPLALELAAALARFLPQRQIRALIEDDAEAALTSARADLPARHRSLGALFNESLRLLSDPVRRVLTELATFEGDFDATAAEFVAGANIASLGALVDALLLTPREGRFGMHPLLGQLLRARGAGPSERAQSAHATYYSEFLGRLTNSLQGPGQLEAVAAIEAETNEVRAAWRWAIAHERFDLLETARRALYSFLMFTGKFRLADELAEAALGVTGPEHPETRSSLLIHHAWVLFRLGKTSAATDCVRESLAISREAELPWKWGYGADGRVVTSALFLGLGNYEAAYSAATQSLALAEAAGDEAGIAFANWISGTARLRIADSEWDGEAEVAERHERLREASAYIERAAEILEGWGEHWMLGFVEIERGLIARSARDNERACGHFRKAYALRRRLNDPQGMSSALIYLCDSLADIGQLESTEELYPEIRALVTRSGDATGMAEVLRSEGLTAIALGEYERARTRLSEALSLSVALSFTNNTVGALRGLGLVIEHEGMPDLARRIMACVATHHSGTPGTRTAARLWLRENGWEVPGSKEPPENLDSLIDEAIRSSVSITDWLNSAEGANDAGAVRQPWYARWTNAN